MSQFPFYSGGYAIPSMQAVLEGVENQPWFGRVEQQVWLPATIVGTALDAGNTVTNVLRSGLLLGRVTATGLLKEWAPAASDGSEIIYGVLGAMINTLMNTQATDRYVGFVMVAGNLFSDRIIVPGTAAEGIVGHANEFQILQQLKGRFLLDRHLIYYGWGPFGAKFRALSAAEIAADAVTVLASDHGRTFVNTGADATTVYTLPLAQVGLTFTFHATVAQTMTINRTAPTVFNLPGSVAATTLALTAGETVTFIGVSSTAYMVIASEAATD